MSDFSGSLQTLQARYGVAIPVPKGKDLVVVNTHGTQAIDFWALSSANLDEFQSMEHTRSRLSRVIPKVGDAIYSNRRAEMLTLTEDTSPGVHDTLLCACSPEIYREHGCAPDHRSCETNFHEALGAIGKSLGCTPAPFNLFMNVAVGPDSEVIRAAPVSRPGDYVRFRADMDVIVVMSACPQDVTPINGDDCTPRDIQYAVV